MHYLQKPVVLYSLIAVAAVLLYKWYVKARIASADLHTADPYLGVKAGSAADQAIIDAARRADLARQSGF